MLIAYTPHDSESNYQGTFSEILIKQKEIELHTLLLTYKLYSSIKVSFSHRKAITMKVKPGKK